MVVISQELKNQYIIDITDITVSFNQGVKGGCESFAKQIHGHFEALKSVMLNHRYY